MGSTGTPAWRWLGVGDNVSSESQANTNLSSFRNDGGFWYYGTNDFTHKPTWMESFTDTVNGMGGPDCSAARSVDVNVYTYDQADKSNLSGLWIILTNAAPGTQYTGFSPLHVEIPAGSYTIYADTYGQDHSTIGGIGRPPKRTQP